MDRLQDLQRQQAVALRLRRVRRKRDRNLILQALVCHNSHKTYVASLACVLSDKQKARNFYRWVEILKQLTVMSMKE